MSLVPSLFVFLFLISSCQSQYPIRSCFSPEGKCDEELIETIRRSRTSLDIAVFDLTHPQIVHEILLASKRGKVRVLVDKRQSKGTHSLISTLVRAGLEVRSGRQRGIMHHKFMIIDGQELETGSFNFTEGASFRNQENQVYLKDPEVVKIFRAQFEKMWAEAKVLSNP
jgi:phosphatidylserine/phosphatidylglycerophosphate/cardiolipin synthase-like enzyme